MKSDLSPDTIRSLTTEITRQISGEIALHNQRVADQLVDSSKILATDLVGNNERIAQRLAEYNANLAHELAITNRDIADKLVISTRDVASKLLLQNQQIAEKVEATTTTRFERQKAWSWSLIATNVLICMILIFFAVAFSRFAVQAFFTGHL